jgi:hypothetical protein
VHENGRVTSLSDPAPEASLPKVFQIGMTGMATRWLRRVFRSAGYTAAPGENAPIALDICYAARTGGRPLTAYSEVDLFTDMEHTSTRFEPPLHGQHEFELLHEHFPDAYFILNVGNLDAWLRRRANARGRAHLETAARVLDLEEDEVPEVWRRRWLEHDRSVRSHFAGHERFMVFDVEVHGLADLSRFVKEDYDLTGPDLPEVPRRRAGRAGAAGAASTTPGSRGEVTTHFSQRFVDDVVEFATRTDPTVPTGLDWRRTSRLYAFWPGSDLVLDNRDRPLPCAVELTETRWPFLMNAESPKHRRTEGVLNEFWQHGGRRAARVDMQDARRYGTARTGAPDSAVLVYCRLEGAANLVLWPLPGYHTPGEGDFPGPASLDTLAFEDKSDVLAWRGNLTGRALPELGPGGRHGEHATQLADLLGTGRDPEIVAKLETVPRYRVLDRLAGRPDADVGLVLGEKWSAKEVPEQIARLVRPRLTYQELYRSRYLLSLSGNDSASNFLMAADSSSVVLREEDGWECFFDGLFRAWEHYVPIVRGGDDLEDRLDWARSHPDECQEMARRSREAIRRLVDPRNRRAYLNGIREVYESRL